MTLVYDKLSATAVFSESESVPEAAYWNYPYLRSPHGRYIGGNDPLNTSWLADTSDPPSLVWARDFTTVEVDDFFGVARTGFQAVALDDEGSMWGNLSLADGVAEVPINTNIPIQRYNWTDESDPSGEQVLRIWAYTLPNDSIFLLFHPQGTAEQAAHRYYTAIKGDETLNTNTAVGWRPSTSFQDDNGDVWIVGIPDEDPIDTMTLTRITDVTSGLGYASPQSFTIPTSATPGCFPVGLYADGAFVGVIHRTGGFSDTLFRAELDDSGDITILDASANRVAFAFPDIGYAMQNSPDPSNIFVLRENDDSRVITKMLPDLTFTDTYDLDDWEAGDHATETAPETVFFPLYCDHRLAFYGTRYQFTDPPDNLNQAADLFIYYFGPDESGGGDGGDGLQDTSVRLRVWGYGLDGHKHIVWRVGPSETLVFDPTTRQWASFASPGRNNWRAHVGQNWLGMSTNTLANGFGSDIVAGDDATGVLWILDPTIGRDDRSTSGSDPFNRVVTGGLSLTGRDVLACGALQLDYSTGDPTQTGATFTLETSDDWGKTFDSHGSVTVAADDNDFCGVEWRGLGQARAPGRVFRITDNGAAIRLSGATLR